MLPSAYMLLPPATCLIPDAYCLLLVTCRLCCPLVPQSEEGLPGCQGQVRYQSEGVQKELLNSCDPNNETMVPGLLSGVSLLCAQIICPVVHQRKSHHLVLTFQ